jgi:hypothetical protein
MANIIIRNIQQQNSFKIKKVMEKGLKQFVQKIYDEQL